MTTDTNLDVKRFFTECFRTDYEPIDLSILKLKEKSKNKQGVKSVLIPSAQSAELCELPTYMEQVKCAYHIINGNDPEIPIVVSALCELQLLYGLRVSEVLSIKPSCVSSLGHIKVNASKGSLDRIVNPVKYVDFWLKFKRINVELPKYVNRFYLYRIYKKKGIYKAVSNGVNSSVTHLLRYNYILSLLNDGNSLTDIQNVIGHKNIKSTAHYVDNIKKNC